MSVLILHIGFDGRHRTLQLCVAITFFLQVKSHKGDLPHGINLSNCDNKWWFMVIHSLGLYSIPPCGFPVLENTLRHRILPLDPQPIKPWNLPQRWENLSVSKHPKGPMFEKIIISSQKTPQNCHGSTHHLSISKSLHPPWHWFFHLFENHLWQTTPAASPVAVHPDVAIALGSQVHAAPAGPTSWSVQEMRSTSTGDFIAKRLWEMIVETMTANSSWFRL